jgi:hypothetical protein
MVGQSVGESEVFLRGARAENRLGQLTVTVVATRLDLEVQAAVATVWMVKRGHAPFIAARGRAAKERLVPSTMDGGPARLYPHPATHFSTD